jgi:hypothetical protein
MALGLACGFNRVGKAQNFSGGTMRNSRRHELNCPMQFEEQNAAMRQMKELLRDQAKFRAKLDRVVRKIETSSQRTAKLAERNKTRKQPAPKGKQGLSGQMAVEQEESEKVHGDKIHAFDHEGDSAAGEPHDHQDHGHSENHAGEEHHAEAISAQGS